SSTRDWSSDVCSSDLASVIVAGQGSDGDGNVRTAADRRAARTTTTSSTTTTTTLPTPNSDGELHLVRTVTGDISPKSVVASGRRSEERRVGKEERWLR